MSRTKGSGWGGGVMLYQICPSCGRKKVLYDPLPYVASSFKCTSCRIRFYSDRLIRKQYLNQKEEK